MIPMYWRRAYYEEFGNSLLGETALPGQIVSTSTTVTLTEPSYVRIIGKCYIGADDANWRWAALMIYEGVGGVTLQDASFATAYFGGAASSDYQNSMMCLWDSGVYTAGPYVFELRARGAAANRATARYIRWSIDVCRA